MSRSFTKYTQPSTLTTDRVTEQQSNETMSLSNKLLMQL